jgi:hypothetical protein
MDRHLTRWVSQLANLIVVMTTYIGQSPNRQTVLDLAERLEEMAANVRNRAPEK